MNTTNKEIWATICESSKRGLKYEISNMGHFRSTKSNGEIKYLGYGNRNRQTGYLLSPIGEYMHRLVAKHFCKNPDPARYKVVSHKNTCKEDNTASNLEWTDIASNNRNPLTMRKRAVSMQHRPARHQGEVIRGVSPNGEVRYWTSGIHCARELQRSHVLVYNALNKRQSAKRCAGYELTWQKLDELAK